MTLLICNDGLIGDFLGIIPLMTELANHDELHVDIHPEIEYMLHFVPHKYNILLRQPSATYHRVINLNVKNACEISKRFDYYMTQAHFAYVGLPVPVTPPKAELEFARSDGPYFDYILAPFSRSLTPPQQWQKEQWQRLVDLMPTKTFCLIGHERDDKNFIHGGNITGMFNEPLVNVMNALKNARKGLISVVSGPSHLSFHLGVKNYLLTNQAMTWGNNPDAVQIRDPIPHLQAEKLMRILEG